MSKDKLVDWDMVTGSGMAPASTLLHTIDYCDPSQFAIPNPNSQEEELVSLQKESLKDLINAITKLSAFIKEACEESEFAKKEK